MEKGISTLDNYEKSQTPSCVADDEQPEFDDSGAYGDTIYGDGGRLLLIHMTLFSPKTPIEDDWLCTSIFHTTSKIITAT